MATAYSVFDSQVANVVATVKQHMLASTDWAHLQLTSGTGATTLSAGASAGATSISTVASIPSGSYIVIGNGAANPEVRVTTGVSGAGPFTVTFATALAATYASAAAVGVGSYVKATTTRGAQMVLDLADAAVSATNLQIGVYRTHDGTTAGDKVTRYIRWRNSGGATTDPLHVIVSAGKEHLFVSVEGPRAGETNAESATFGSSLQVLFIGDIVPYFTADTIPAVILCAAATSSISPGQSLAAVSRDQADVNSWVPCVVASLGTTGGPTSLPANASDGNTYLWPYVVVESSAGLRGRISKLWAVGPNSSYAAFSPFVPGFAPGATYSYSSETYVGVNVAFRNMANANSGSYGPLVLSNILANQTSVFVGAVPSA